jgi:hypothetical protein
MSGREKKRHQIGGGEGPKKCYLNGPLASKAAAGGRESNLMSPILIVQWKPLNVITLGQSETDNINQMITISE